MRNFSQSVRIVPGHIARRMGLFQTLRQSEIARRVQSARSIVIYAAPGVSAPVAEALVRTAARLPGGVIAILDVSAHAARMGYGRFEKVEELMRGGVDVRQEQGLRQALLIVDDHGWAFTLPAELIETDAPEQQTAPNAVELTTAQVLFLRGELPQPRRPNSQALSLDPPEPSLPATLGAERVAPQVLKRVKLELEVAPPQPFDLARQVQVYTALVRFVELEMKGWKLEGRRVELPVSRLPILATRDRDLKQRVRSSLHLLDKIQDGQLKKLRREIEEIRKHFCRPVGGLGSLVLVSAQSVLEERVAAVQEKLAAAKAAITAEIETALKQVMDGLIPELARAVLNDPPDAFRGQYGQSPDGAAEYVRAELTRVFPTADEIVGGMSLRLTFKDVTYGMLKDQKFKDKVLLSFSRSALPGDLLQEYDAARKRADAAPEDAGGWETG